MTDPVRLRLDCKGGAVAADLEYSARIPLNPHRTEDYEVPDAPGADQPGPDAQTMDAARLDALNMDVLWLHLIKRRMDRVRFLVRGPRHVLRMIKYRRQEGKERQAWILAVTPLLRPGLELHLDDPEAEHPSSVLQSAGSGVLKLGPSETFAVQRMDGQRSFQDIYMEHIDELGLVSPDALARLYESLESMGMLADGAGGTGSRLARLARKAFNPDISIPRADAVVTAVHAWARPLLGRPGALLLLAAGLSGLVPALLGMSRFREVTAGLEAAFLAQPWLVVPLYVMVMVHAMLHELGHGVTCKHFGGRVPRLGIMFYLATFIFYCDTTAAWNFQDKRRRLLVSLGGPMVSLAVLSAGLWTALALAGTGSPWESTVVAFCLLAAFGLAMNFNPFIKMDAYYMLVDLTGIPNLRTRSFRHLETRLLSRLGLSPAGPRRSRPGSGASSGGTGSSEPWALGCSWPCPWPG